MKTTKLLIFSGVICICSHLASPGLPAAEIIPPVAPVTPATAAATAEDVAAQQTLRAYLQMQEQLHATQRAVEESRVETENVTRRNAEVISARLNLIEQSIAAQRQRALEATQNSNRVLLLLVGVLAGIAVLAMVCTAWFQTRAMNRMAEAAEALRQISAFGHPFALGAPGEVTMIYAGDAVDQSSARFLGDLDRLQKRIQELEAGLLFRPAGEPSGANGVAREISETAARVGLLLGKGESLLKLDQADGALACFEEALAIDPTNIEALLKKGTALERLERTEEAIVSYDRAIAADQTATTAYLFKGGAYNRLKRYAEAVECYEQALTHQKSAA